MIAEESSKYSRSNIGGSVKKFKIVKIVIGRGYFLEYLNIYGIIIEIYEGSSE